MPRSKKSKSTSDGNSRNGARIPNVRIAGAQNASAQSNMSLTASKPGVTPNNNHLMVANSGKYISVIILFTTMSSNNLKGHSGHSSMPSSNEALALSNSMRKGI